MDGASHLPDIFCAQHSRNANYIEYCTLDESDYVDSSSDERETTELNLQRLETKIKAELDQIDTKKNQKMNKISEDVHSLLENVVKQKDEIEKKVDKFYVEKKLKLQRALTDASRLHNLFQDTNNEIFERNLLRMMKEFLYTTRNLLNTDTIFEGSTFLKSKHIGSLIEPIFEKPKKSFTYQLDALPSNIISTSDGFLALQRDDVIINLQSKKVVVKEEGRIININPTYDGQLSYVLLQNNKYRIKLMNYDNFGKNEYVVDKNDVDPKTLMYGIFEDCIILRSRFSKRTYFYEKPFLSLIVWENDLENDPSKVRHKTFPEGLCIADESTIQFFDVKKVMRISFDIDFLPADNISMYNDIFAHILKDKKLMRKRDELLLIDKNHEIALSVEQEKVFPKNNLVDYMITDKEVIFCLTDRLNPKMVSIHHYPKFEKN